MHINNKLIFEIIILIIIFSLSLYYSLSNNTSYLVATCNDCKNGICESFSTVKSGIISSNYDLNLFLKTETGTNYSYSIFSGQFKSCELTNPDYFEDIAYITTDIMTISSYNHKQQVNFNNKIIKNFTINTDCFQLECKMQNIPGYNPIPGHLVIPENIEYNKSINYIKMFGQIIMQDTNVNANCYVNINDILFPFLSASNTFTESDIFKCNVKPNIIVSLGVALSYILTTLSIIKAFDRFYTIYKNKQNKDNIINDNL